MANVKKLNKLMVDKGTKLPFWLFQFTFEPKVKGLENHAVQVLGVGTLRRHPSGTSEDLKTGHPDIL